MNPIKTMLRMSTEERENYLRSLQHESLLYLVIPFFENESQRRKQHSNSVMESAKKKRKIEEIEPEFQCDWETVKSSDWMKGLTATTLRNHRSAHLHWTELSLANFPDIPVNKLLLELLNNPEVIEDHLKNSVTWGASTKADRVKYLLASMTKLTVSRKTQMWRKSP